MQILQARRCAYLSLFCCISTAPQGGILSHSALPLLVSTFANTDLSPRAKGLLPLHKSSPFTSFFCDWQRGASVSAMIQLNSPWEFYMLCHGCWTPHAFYNHNHHLFIMSWTWGGLKADVTHDDLTSMGKWTRWLIVSKTNTLIISRRAQCNRSLTTNLCLS